MVATEKEIQARSNTKSEARKFGNWFLANNPSRLNLSKIQMRFYIYYAVRTFKK